MKKSLLCAAAVAAALLGSAPAGAAEPGVLVIKVGVLSVDNVENDPGDGDGWCNSFWIKNIATGKTYGGLSMTGGLEVLDVPEGFYCVSSVRTGNNVGLVLDYCGEPFFRVVGGQLNNAGRWRFLRHGGKTPAYKLFGSLEDQASVLARAKERFPERFLPAAK